VPYEVVESFLNALLDALLFASGPAQHSVHSCTDEIKPPRP
jgi:hypothetical protein